MFRNFKKASTQKAIAEIISFRFIGLDCEMVLKIENFEIKDEENKCKIMIKETASNFKEGKRGEFIIHVFKSKITTKSLLICYKYKIYE